MKKFFLMVFPLKATLIASVTFRFCARNKKALWEYPETNDA